MTAILIFIIGVILVVGFYCFAVRGLKDKVYSNHQYQQPLHQLFNIPNDHEIKTIKMMASGVKVTIKKK